MKKIALFGLLAIMLVFGFIACDSGSSSGGEDKYTAYGSGLTQSEWDTYLPGIAPSDLINQSYNASERNMFFSNLASDNNGIKLTGQTETQIRAAFTQFGITDNDFINTVINKLKTQGWVFYAIQPAQSSTDYADVVGIRKE